VILVDLDFRNPYLSSIFPEAGPQGLSDVAMGHVTLGEVLTPVILTSPRGGATASNGGGGHATTLRVLSAGTLPPTPGEFIGSEAVDRVLSDLRERADLVLIDSAPMLGIGDSLTLASKVEALILVTRLNRLRRPIVSELERLLARCQAKPLGLVITAAHPAEGYGYAYEYDRAPGEAPGPAERRARPRQSELRS
jgi:Mrp family chromosome partitioning ATPase